MDLFSVSMKINKIHSFLSLLPIRIFDSRTRIGTVFAILDIYNGGSFDHGYRIYYFYIVHRCYTILSSFVGPIRQFANKMYKSFNCLTVRNVFESLRYSLHFQGKNVQTVHDLKVPTSMRLHSDRII